MYLGSICTAASYRLEQKVVKRWQIYATTAFFSLMLTASAIYGFYETHKMTEMKQERMLAMQEFSHKKAMEEHYQMQMEMDAIVGETIAAQNAARFQAEAEAEARKNVVKTGSGAIRMSEAEKYHLVQLVFAESGMETYSDKLSVAKVVLKRTASPEYPDTVDGVIWQSYQFEPAKRDGTIRDGSGNDLSQKELPESCYQAVEQAISECSAGDFGPYLNFVGNGPGNGNSFS